MSCLKMLHIVKKKTTLSKNMYIYILLYLYMKQPKVFLPKNKKEVKKKKKRVTF